MRFASPGQMKSASLHRSLLPGQEHWQGLNSHFYHLLPSLIRVPWPNRRYTERARDQPTHEINLQQVQTNHLLARPLVVFDAQANSSLRFPVA